MKAFNLSTLQVEKFPDLLFEGRRLIWDSRQAPDGRPEWVICPQDRYSNHEIEKQLKARVGAWVIGPRGSGAQKEVANPRRFLGEAASAALGFPSRELKVVAITGTNGKTTSTAILSALLRSGGARVAELGTLGLRIFQGNTLELTIDTGFTTPEAPTLHKIIADLRSANVSSLIMEASSHAIELGRIAGVDFDGAIFTNLTQDHLDFHGSMADYENAKAKLFSEYLGQKSLGQINSTKTRVAVVNTADMAGHRIMASLPLGLRALGFALNRTFQIENSSLLGLNIRFENEQLQSPLVGVFNAENIIGAYLMARELSGQTAEALRVALSHFAGAHGRLEKITEAQANVKKYVFVDYAHTPDALEKSLGTLQYFAHHAPQAMNPKLFVVFGCGGDRDRGKRPLMGAIAARIADRVIVTNDNPRTENPASIIAEIVAGVADLDLSKVTEEKDRKTAIECCLKEMTEGDICLIAGKGHEDYQIVGNEKKAFSDFEVVRNWVAKRAND